MEFIELLSIAALSIFFFMTMFWVLSLVRKDAGVVDVGWGLGFILVSFTTMFFNVSFVLRSFLVMAIVALWGLRLAIYLYLRNHGRSEDWRYAQWRDKWGSSFLWRSYFDVFLIQGVLMLLISIPIIFVHYRALAESLMWADLFGAVIWFVGFVIETLADYQLMLFRSRNSNTGKIMMSGLWRYSRHPNYFGEAVQWWGLFVIALALPGGIFTLVGPLTITILLVKVSGVALLEKRYKGRSDYAQYKRVTSSFIPWFPKKTMGERVGSV